MAVWYPRMDRNSRRGRLDLGGGNAMVVLFVKSYRSCGKYSFA